LGKKNCCFYLFKIAMQLSVLQHFHIYIYYNLNWFSPKEIFLLFTLVPIFMVISTDLKIL
jgi:hypothetical protein